ncbi:hypothetical protein [Roseateles sp.]|uniref:hypothetical protein n=1 Tax=Roseateles sp. TaxID=1971397 RepID=UPI00392AD668
MKHALTAAVVSVCLVLVSGAALAQATAASAPMGSASMPHECKSRHDHGAERGMPSGATMNCAKSADEAASAPAKRKVKPHDHAKFHKNQG